MSKIVGRQLATERFTEPREAIVTRFRKRTPTQGGLLLGVLKIAIRWFHRFAALRVSLLPVVGDCGRAAWLLTPPCRKGVFSRIGTESVEDSCVQSYWRWRSHLHWNKTLRQPQPKSRWVFQKPRRLRSTDHRSRGVSK
jgi:hypothetical protein